MRISPVLPRIDGVMIADLLDENVFDSQALGVSGIFGSVLDLHEGNLVYPEVHQVVFSGCFFPGNLEQAPGEVTLRCYPLSVKFRPYTLFGFDLLDVDAARAGESFVTRSEERRVGKECMDGGEPGPGNRKSEEKMGA